METDLENKLYDMLKELDPEKIPKLKISVKLKIINNCIFLLRSTDTGRTMRLSELAECAKASLNLECFNEDKLWSINFNLPKGW